MASEPRYTPQLLSEAVIASESFAGVLRYLGLRQAGGTQSHIERRIRHFVIDTGHFTDSDTGRASGARAADRRETSSRFGRKDRLVKSHRRFAGH